MGLSPGEPLGDLLATIGLDFQGVKTPAYRVHMPDRTFDIVSGRRRVRIPLPGDLFKGPAIGSGSTMVLETSGKCWEQPLSCGVWYTQVARPRPGRSGS